MEIQLLRHATLIVTFAGRRLLVDPMLSPEGSLEPVPNATPETRIPMRPLPFDPEELGALLDGIDAVLVTHTHRDHWDGAAAERIPHDRTVFCQSTDQDRIVGAGFGDVRPVGKTMRWDGIEVHRTDGQHGTGETARAMGPVSGFVLRAPGEPTVYVAGDTVLCPEVELTIRDHRPAATVVNAGAARFLTGDPITMTATEVEAVAALEPTMAVVAVHMDTVNHCHLSRSALREHLGQSPVGSQVVIPEDGDRTVWLG